MKVAPNVLLSGDKKFASNVLLTVESGIKVADGECSITNVFFFFFGYKMEFYFLPK